MKLNVRSRAGVCVWMCVNFTRIWPFVVVITGVSIHIHIIISCCCNTQNWFCRWAAPTQTHSVPCITLSNLISSKAPLGSLALAPEKQIVLSTNIIQTDLFSFQLFWQARQPAKNKYSQVRQEKKKLNVTFLWWRESFCGFEMISFLQVRPTITHF